MIAVKFHSQNPNNTQNIPAECIWKKVVILDNEESLFESNGYSTYSDLEFEEVNKNSIIRLQNHYLSVLQSNGDYKYLNVSIKIKKEFADDLIERLKKKNISENINAMQGLWMHQKIRALPVTLYGITFTVDLMNMVVSGDIELACISLQNTTPDDMSLPYHWLSADRISWIVTELKKFLGWP
jgi:hypothetical protein